MSSQRGTDGRGVTVQIRGDFEQLFRRIAGGATASSKAFRLGNPAFVPLERE